MHLTTRAACSSRGGGQGEHRLLRAVGVIQDQQVLYPALDPVEFEVVGPLEGGLLPRAVPLGQPVGLAEELGHVVHVERHILRQGERKGQDVVALDLLRLGGAVARREHGLHRTVFFRISLLPCLNGVGMWLECRFGFLECHLEAPRMDAFVPKVGERSVAGTADIEHAHGHVQRWERECQPPSVTLLEHGDEGAVSRQPFLLVGANMAKCSVTSRSWFLTSRVSEYFTPSRSRMSTPTCALALEGVIMAVRFSLPPSFPRSETRRTLSRCRPR